MGKKSLWWKIPLAVGGTATGVAVLLLAAVASVLYVPPIRKAALNTGITIAQKQTGYDIDLGGIYLSPLHQSPLALYRAYKGQEDLPLAVEIDSLFVGHRGQDTLIYVHALRLHATALTGDSSASAIPPIQVEELHLDQTVFHSNSLIEAVGVNVAVNSLDVSSPELLIAEGKYPLHGLRLSGADIAIDLRETPPDTTAQDTTPLLLAFEAPDGELRDIHFALTPLGIDIRTKYLATNVLADVGANLYDARRLNIRGLGFSLGELHIPVDTIYGNARISLADNLITSRGLHVRANELGAKADIYATELNLETMRVEATIDAEYKGSKANIRASYDIDDEAYEAAVQVERVNLTPFLNDSVPVIVAGEINAEGKGIDPSSPAMQSKVHLHLTDAVYDNITASGITLDAELADKAVSGTLHLPVAMRDRDLRVRAQTAHQFRVSDFMTPESMGVDYHAQVHNLHAHAAGEDWTIDHLRLNFATDSATALDLKAEGLNLTARSPQHILKLVDNIQPLLNALGDSAVMQPLTLLQDLTMIDTLRRLVPELQAEVELTHGSPAQQILDSMGLDIEQITLSFASDSARTDIALKAATPDIDHPEDSTALRLPAVNAALNVSMTEGKTDATITAETHLADGVMNLHDLCTDAAFRMDLTREEGALHGKGRLTLDSLTYGDMDLGNHAVNMQVSPSQAYENALRADVQLDDIPLGIVDGIVSLMDVDLQGAVRASASVDGLPAQTDISAEVQPLGVAVEYKPYEIKIGLGETPIIMAHNHVDFNGLPIYGADSTYLAISGGLDIDSMRLDITLAADSFAPVKLTKGGPLPVYGDLATNIHGSVTGPLDSITADVELTLLPVTDITYPISKKNLAQVKPHGTVRARYGVADGALDLGGRINVDDGFIRYSPKIYPVMPFHVDSGSYVAFNGPIGQTMLDVSASQKVKANVQSEGEDVRSVDFTTGVRVKGVLDSIDFKNIGFFLEAPTDEVVSEELASVDEDRREEIAAVLLATGMYMGESNVANQHNGYALTSIINSRIDASLTNSKHGKVVDINISSSENERGTGTSNDFGVSLSKSFFKDRFRVTVGASISENPEANNAVGLFGMASAEYKLNKEGNVLLRAFTQRDYNNILEGDLQKSGIGLRVAYEWKRDELYRTDSITRTYGIVADADVAYRSNNSIGPNITLKSSVKNLMGRNETFSVKGYGAYYWALRERHPGDPKKSDTYKLGVDAALIFPYLHWAGDDHPDGDTRYRIGYGYENIAGGYGVHKISGSLTYFFRSPRSRFITHAFTPVSLSIVRMKAESDSLLSKVAEYPQLIKLLASNEFVPSVGYEFTYNNYRSKRAVNTMIDLEFKEAGNLINAIYCLFGKKWNDKDKPLGSVTFNQFVKLSAELHNKFNLTDKVSIATRLYAGANIPLGNSLESPLSECFYTGGPNSLRASSPYAYGPGNFYSFKYNQNFFHSGDVKLEANFELRFPIVWKLYGAAFVDAGNVWNWHNASDILTEEDYAKYTQWMELTGDLYDGILDNPELAKEIALGTGAGLRLDIDGLVIRLDVGVGIHAPYQTYKYDKDRKPDLTQPITTYYNIPSALDAFRINFGIGYPF